MFGQTPSSAHDVVPRRSSNGGAKRRSPIFAASPRRPIRFAPRQTDEGGPLPRNGSWALAAAVMCGMALVLAAPATAQRAPDKQDATERRQEKSDIRVTGRRPGSTCNGTASAQPIDYACLNRELKTAATSAQPAPSATDAIASQTTTPSKVGTFSHAATAQRMGKNFGKSAQPYRPPAPQYTNPVRGAPPR